MFSGGLLAPGHTQQACVAVQAAGADPADEVVLLAQNVAGSLAGYLTITVEQPAGTTVLTVSCSFSAPTTDGNVPRADVSCTSS